MALPDYDQYDAVGLATLVRSGELTAREVLEEAIARAEAVNPALNFLAHRAYDVARAAADDVHLPRGALMGVPWLVKELASMWGGQPFTNTSPHCVSLSVSDSAALLDVTAGALPGEPYGLPRPTRPFRDEVGANTGRLRIALVTDTPDHGTPLDGEIKQAVEEAGRLMASLGHGVEPQPVPYDFWPLYKTYSAIIAVQTAAFFDSMAGLVGRAATCEDMAPLYWSMIARGRRYSGPDHCNQVEAMRASCRSLLTRMAAFDLWLVPMLPRVHGYYDMHLDVDTYDDTRMGPDCCYTAPFNASGAPAMSVLMG